MAAAASAIGRGCDRDTGGAIAGKSIHGRWKWRGKAIEARLLRVTQLDGAAIAGREQRILILIAAMPDRPDGVDQHASREPVASGDLASPVLQPFRVRHSASSSGPAARWIAPSTPPPAQQRRVGGVDDGVNAKRGDVGNDDFQPRSGDLARSQVSPQAAAVTATPLSAKQLLQFAGLEHLADDVAAANELALT